LHLTASIVKTKFPNITTISSEQLIEKVQDLHFCDYYDHMVRIMKHEQMKLNENNNTSTSSSSFFTKFKNFFSLTDNAPNNANKQNTQPANEMTTITKKPPKVPDGAKDKERHTEKKEAQDVQEKNKRQRQI